MTISEYIALGNLLLYVSVLIYWHRQHGITVGWILWLYFTLSSVATFFFIRHPFYVHSLHNGGEFKIIPFIYLFVILYLCISPFNKLKKIEVYIYNLKQEKLLRYFMFLSIVVNTIAMTVDSSQIVDVLSINEDFVTDYKDYSYEEVTYIPSLAVPVLSQLKGWLLLGFKIFELAIAFFAVCYYRNIFSYIFMTIAILADISEGIIVANRSTFLYTTLFSVVYVYAFWNQFVGSFKNYLRIGGGVLALIIIPFVLTITIGRFGNENDVLTFFFFKYMGEPMNNFNTLLFDHVRGYTLGDAYFLSFFNNLFGIAEWNTTLEKWSFIEARTGVSGQFFYTFVGGLILEFGKIATLCIAIILNILLNHILHKKHFSIADYILLSYSIYYLIRGVFFLPTQGKPFFTQAIALVIIWHLFGKSKDSVTTY